MASAEAGLALWRLAACAHERPDVEAAILAGRRWENASPAGMSEEGAAGAEPGVRGVIAAVSGGDEFLARWDEFMERHGHHTRVEYEVANARWCECPDEVLGMVRSYIQGLGAQDRVAEHARLAAERVALGRWCRRRLVSPLKRLLFDALLSKAQSGFLFRENLRSQGVRCARYVRRMLLELGERLVARGVLDARDDIFFLHMEELGPACDGRAGLDARRTVAVRRVEYERNRAITPPPLVVGRFDPDEQARDAFDENTKEFPGLAASPGVACGRARVILRAGADQVLPGEVLVAPFTDPGWTPYFLNAVAIVIDLGGMLSHGSVIAREYGIPAVVNVGGATKVVKNGQMLEVDGNCGRVRIIDAPSDTSHT
jgi:pyruvate,water dikinase